MSLNERAAKIRKDEAEAKKLEAEAKSLELENDRKKT
jgi:F0F1-type ATP synthase membrane subunit b/b'